MSGMERLTRQHDWSSTALGAYGTWPQSLRTTVEIMLASGHAMCVMWGPDLTFLYNDAYAPFLGTRHPAALGKPAKVVWPDVWNDIEPLIERTFRGENCTFHELPMTMTRHGFEEETWWDFSYSPVREESGDVAGLLNVTSESTARVLALRQRDAAVKELRTSEGRLAALVEASSDSLYSMSPDWREMKQLDGRGFIANTDAPSVRWMDTYLFPEDRAEVSHSIDAAVTAAVPFELEHRVRRADGTVGWTFSRAVPVQGTDGRIVEWFGMAADVTARHQAEAALRESEAFMASVLASSTDCIKVLDLDGNLTFMSEGGMDVMEISDFNDVKGCPWPDFLKGDGVALAYGALEEARHGRSAHFVTPADTFAGTPRYWSVSVSPILGADGRTERILSVSRDITELEHAREKQQLLNGELAHRIKNTLSVVQAIAHQTLGQVTDECAMKAFGDRIAALAASHNLLTGQDWSSAQLDDVARSAVSTFGADRFMVSGPSIGIGPRATLSLSLMLHELATNAVKYGALSVPEGKVTLRWTVGDEKMDLVWQEQGGPPAVEPTRRGFGSRIIRMGLIGSGGVNLTYGTEGLTMEASAPLHQVQEA